MSSRCDLDLEDSTHTQKIVFSMTLRLMRLHRHTQFGNKMFCGSEDIVWTNIH